MNFNALTVAKYAVSAIVGLGTKKIVVNVIKNNVLPTSPIEKATVTAAAWVISAMVTEATQKYTDEGIDKTAGFVTKIVDQVKLANKLTRIGRKESTFEKEGLDPEDFVQDPITKKWSPIEVVEPEPVSDETMEKMRDRVKEAGLPVSFEKNAAGEWMIVDLPTSS